MFITVQDEKMDRFPDKLIITLIARQGEIIQVRLRIFGSPIMVTQAGEKAVFKRTIAIPTCVGKDKLVEELPNILVDRGCLAIGIVIITSGDNEFRIPALNQGSYIGFRLLSSAIIADDCKVQNG